MEYSTSTPKAGPDQAATSAKPWPRQTAGVPGHGWAMAWPHCMVHGLTTSCGLATSCGLCLGRIAWLDGHVRKAVVGRARWPHGCFFSRLVRLCDAA
ncbi:hypothetical protein R1flu_021097 [Riccia fluitans]|uniref:Uncharacterized protein n=1 Tax=Riccia fluitans TaxID=41844 RepID=A0ABD1ZS31_9MARC